MPSKKYNHNLNAAQTEAAENVVATQHPGGKLTLFCVFGLLGSASLMSVAFAHQVSLDGPIEAGAGYVVTGDGLAVKSGDGDCVLGSDYSDDVAIDACLGIEATPEKVEAPKPAPTPAKSKVVSTRDISGAALFALNSSELSETGLAAIQDVIREVAQFQGVTEIEIIGHTDSTGAEDYNQALSERRAETVKEAIGKGYPEVNIVELASTSPDIKLVSRGLGESSPIADNSTREGRAENRRVEILIKAREVKFE